MMTSLLLSVSRANSMVTGSEDPSKCGFFVASSGCY